MPENWLNNRGEPQRFCHSVHFDRLRERIKIAKFSDSSTLEDDLKDQYMLFAIAEGFPEGHLSELLGSYSSIHDAMLAVPKTTTKYCIFDRKDLKVVFTGYGKHLITH
jgi:hypothetical protein